VAAALLTQKNWRDGSVANAIRSGSRCYDQSRIILAFNLVEIKLLSPAFRSPGEVRDPLSRQPQLGAQDYAVAQAVARQTEPQAGDPVQKLLLSSGQLDQGTASGGEGGVPLWGVVPAGRVYRDQPDGLKPGGSALLQQASHKIAALPSPTG